MKKLPRVLVNDDEQDLVELIQDALSERGIDSIGSNRCEDALELIESGKADLLVTDIRFPGMGGEELISKLIRKEVALPIIAISGHQTIQNENYPFWPKPFSPNKLADFIADKHEVISDHQFLDLMSKRYGIAKSELGRVLVFFAERGWGLIRMGHQEKPIYVNARDIITEAKFAQLVEGQLVRFELDESSRRGARATRVRVLDK